MAEEQQSPEDLTSLTVLAKNFAAREMYSEACELFQLALRFDPENLGLKLNLAKVRHQQKLNHGHRRDAEELLREELRRNAIDAAHFFGLAALYEERGKQELASECLGIAREKELVNPYVYKLSGKMFFRRQRYAAARDDLRAAQRYNPFDREIAELLGRTEYECENYLAALEATIDAFLLLREGDRDGGQRLSGRIRQYKQALRVDSGRIQEIFHERRDKLQTAFERLDLQRERHLRKKEVEKNGGPEPDPHAGRIELAGRLRACEIWGELDDEQIFHLTAAVHVEELPGGNTVFEYGSDGADIYLLERGRIAIRRPTSYGDFELGVLEAGSVFGEMNFISHAKRSATALVSQDSVLLRLDAEEMAVLLNEEPELGVKVYLSFWHGLSRKLRKANEQLRTFFTAEQGSEEFHKLRKEQLGEAGAVEKSHKDTLALLQEKGLSGDELSTLANFSEAKRFPGGTYLFHEGDEGREMYVVLEGKVMISKYIPGGGEEALAILSRGDFFGEMALIDGEPRSADAKAFQGPVTVVAFNEETLEEALSMEPQAALDFMALLCRLISERLREIDEKVTAWRIMAGVIPEGGETPYPADS